MLEKFSKVKWSMYDEFNKSNLFFDYASTVLGFKAQYLSDKQNIIEVLYKGKKIGILINNNEREIYTWLLDMVTAFNALGV